MKYIRPIAKLFAKNKITWALFVIIFSVVHGALSVVLNHLPELWNGFREIWAEREQVRQDALAA